MSSAFANLVTNQFKPGDTFVLEDMYRISGSDLQLPSDFTLTAEKGGGFDVTDNESNSVLLLLGDRNTIDNVTFTASGAPDTGYEGVNPVRGTDFDVKRFVGIFGADNVTISDSSFSGNIEMFLDVRSSKNLTVENTLFDGGNTQIRLLGASDDATIVESHFRDALGDGIKTERSGEYGPQRTEVLDSFFEGNNRDGIDTAGGFKDALVSNTVFYDNGVSAMDIKTLLERSDDLSPNISNSGIRIEDCQIIDSRNGIVVTMLDRMGALSAANADQLMPHDIVISNTTFEKTAAHTEEMRAFLIKDGHSITWDNLTFLGNIEELRLMNAEAPSGWSAHDVGGTITKYGASDGIQNLWNHSAGPVADGAFPDAGTVDPAPAPDDTVEPPPPSDSTPPVTETEEQEVVVAPPGGGTSSGGTSPEPTGPGIVFSRAGDMVFDGTKGSVIELAPSDALKIDNATISFDFTADRISGRQGLLSKDAKGYEVNNGHYVAYLDNGTLKIRFQEDSQSETFSYGGIKVGTEYSVTSSFGDGKVEVWVNGQSLGSRNFDMTWTDNNEYLQIGGNGWASESGAAGFTDPFDGTIGNVKIATAAEGPVGTDPETVPQEPEPEVPPPVEEPEAPTGGDTGTGGTPPADDRPADPEEEPVTSGGGTGEQPPVGEPEVPDEHDLLFSRAGDMVFNGTRSSVIELAPSDMLKTDSATISFDFNADTVSGRQGLLTKDAKGYEINEGHYAAYIEKGKLLVRFQEGSESEVFSYGGIKAGTDYSVQSSFGDGKVEVWVNGESLGARDFDMSWAQNDEYLQIGGNGWASVSGESGFRDPFDGTISDVSITGNAPTTLNEVSPATYETVTFAVTADDGARLEDPASGYDAETLIAESQPITTTEEGTEEPEADLLRAVESEDDSPRGLFPELLELLRKIFGMSDDDEASSDIVPASYPATPRETAEPFDLSDIVPITGQLSDDLPADGTEEDDRLLVEEFT